jgi:hypothetical protein
MLYLRHIHQEELMLKYWLLLALALSAKPTEAQVKATPKDFVFTAEAQGSQDEASEIAEKKAQEKVFQKIDQILQKCSSKVTERYLPLGSTTTGEPRKISKKIMVVQVTIMITARELETLIELAISGEPEIRRAAIRKCAHST